MLASSHIIYNIVPCIYLCGGDNIEDITTILNKYLVDHTVVMR